MLFYTHPAQEALHRLDRRILSFVHRYFQSISAVPAGLTPSDLDAILGSAELACDDEMHVLWLLREWHKHRQERLNIGLVLMYVKLEVRKVRQGSKCLRPVTPADNFCTRPLVVFYSAAAFILRHASLTCKGRTVLIASHRLKSYFYGLHPSLPLQNIGGPDLLCIYDAIPRAFRPEFHVCLSARCGAPDPAGAVHGTEALKVLLPRPAPPTTPFHIAFRVENMAALYSEGQAQKRNTYMDFKFPSPIFRSGISRLPGFRIAPYGVRTAESLLLGLKVFVVAKEVDYMVSCSLDGTSVKEIEQVQKLVSIPGKGKISFHSCAPLVGNPSKPTGVTGTGTLIAKYSFTRIVRRPARITIWPYSDLGEYAELSNRFVRGLLGPLAAQFLPEAESDESDDESDEAGSTSEAEASGS